MTHKVNRVKSFLLEWIILRGDLWVFHSDAYGDDYLVFDLNTSLVFDMCKRKKYIEEEDQFPTDKYRWGSYYRITKKGRKYATL
jgi:hypothetical protein